MEPNTGNPNPTPTPTPSPTQAPSPLLGADGALSENWLQHEKVPAEMRTNKTLAATRDVFALAGQVHNLEKALGKKRAVVPTDPANKAEVDEFYALGGWPKEGPDKYPVIARPADMPQELKEDPNLTKNWRTWCHEARLSSEQMAYLSQKILGWNIASFKGDQADSVKRQEETRAAMRTDLGPQYDCTVQLANSAAEASLSPEHLAHAREAGWLEDPVYLRQMALFGEWIHPDRLHTNASGGTDTTSIEQKIAELETSDAYRKPDDPRHNAVTQQVLQLRQQLINAQKGR